MHSQDLVVVFGMMKWGKNGQTLRCSDFVPIITKLGNLMSSNRCMGTYKEHHNKKKHYLCSWAARRQRHPP